MRDLLALANAAVQGPRYLVLGVRDTAGTKRTYPGIAPQAWHDTRRRVGALAGIIDPLLAVRARSVDFDGATVGVLSLADCNDPPYLLGEHAPPGLAGRRWLGSARDAAVPVAAQGPGTIVPGKARRVRAGRRYHGRIRGRRAARRIDAARTRTGCATFRSCRPEAEERCSRPRRMRARSPAAPGRA